MRRIIWWTAVVVVMALIGVGLALGLAGVRDNTIDLATARGEIAALSGAVSQANDRLEARGDTPVVVPKVTTATGERGLAGEPGDRGLMGFTGVTGPEGPVSTVPGPVGPASTVPGPAGAASTVPGQAGTDGAAGVDGAPGAPGAPGAAGRGVVTIDCVDAPVTVPPALIASDWVITYTDGLTTTTPGPCRVEG